MHLKDIAGIDVINCPLNGREISLMRKVAGDLSRLRYGKLWSEFMCRSSLPVSKNRSFLASFSTEKTTNLLQPAGCARCSRDGGRFWKTLRNQPRPAFGVIPS